jgi:hypothetical protein
MRYPLPLDGGLCHKALRLGILDGALDVLRAEGRSGEPGGVGLVGGFVPAE